jgi:hypothetical protein
MATYFWQELRKNFVRGVFVNVSAAGAALFRGVQAGLRLCGRGVVWGYLAVHRTAVVALLGCRTVGAKMLAED